MSTIIAIGFGLPPNATSVLHRQVMECLCGVPVAICLRHGCLKMLAKLRECERGKRRATRQPTYRFLWGVHEENSTNLDTLLAARWHSPRRNGLFDLPERQRP